MVDLAPDRIPHSRYVLPLIDEVGTRWGCRQQEVRPGKLLLGRIIQQPGRCGASTGGVSLADPLGAIERNSRGKCQKLVQLAVNAPQQVLHSLYTTICD